MMLNQASLGQRGNVFQTEGPQIFIRRPVLPDPSTPAWASGLTAPTHIGTLEHRLPLQNNFSSIVQPLPFMTGNPRTVEQAQSGIFGTMLPRDIIHGNGMVVPTIPNVPSGFSSATILPVYIMMQPNDWTSLGAPASEGWAELTTNTSTENNTETG